MATIYDDPQTQYNAMAALVKQSGAPMTAENMNRASLHMAQSNMTGPMLFDQAMERAVGAPTQRQARQAVAQAPARPPGGPTTPANPFGGEAGVITREDLPGSTGVGAGTGPLPLPPPAPPGPVAAIGGDVRIDEMGQPVPDTTGGNPGGLSMNAIGPGLLATLAAVRGVRGMKPGAGAPGPSTLSQRVTGTDTPNTTAVRTPPTPAETPFRGSAYGPPSSMATRQVEQPHGPNPQYGPPHLYNSPAGPNPQYGPAVPVSDADVAARLRAYDAQGQAPRAAAATSPALTEQVAKRPRTRRKPAARAEG